MPSTTYTRIASLKTAEDFLAYTEKVGADLPFDREVIPGDGGPLGRPIDWSNGKIGNRLCILPMEGWDGTLDGKPTELTLRRWRNFGLSGAKLLWGGEAVAVRQDGRANPNQLLINDANLASIEALRQVAVDAHQEQCGSSDDLLVGLQLTHSGRYARPHEKKLSEPRTAYRHPILDPRVKITDDSALLSDDDLSRLIEEFVAAAALAERAGFAFVDVKHCHGYLGHELLSGFDRPGIFGGSFENRTRFLREIVSGVRAVAPSLAIGVRLSFFDFSPFSTGEDGVGTPDATTPYRYAFGGDGTGAGYDLAEPSQFLALLERLNIELVCSTAGSPYYNPHIQRPAIFPPSDGYQPPEDPLVGVARQINATAELKRAHPDLILVGTGYSYLQEWLPNVGQAVVRTGGADFIGLGRMVLSYPEMPFDILSGNPLERKRICRTFSECTTAPRNGIVSGCFPLDPFYKTMPEREQVQHIKREAETKDDA